MKCRHFLLALLLFSSPARANAQADACTRLSDAANSSQTSVLVIGFEGLGGFNSSATNQAYDYRCQLIYGQPGSRPAPIGFGGMLLRGLIVPIIKEYKNKVQVLVFPHTAVTGSGTVPEACAESWMQGGAGRRVIITGHSFGGHAAELLAHSLAAKNVRVDSVFTVDPRRRPLGTGGFRTSNNVDKWENFYQKTPLQGFTVSGADNHFLLATTHITIPYHASVLAAMKKRIGNPPGPETIADKSKDICSASTIGHADLYNGIHGGSDVSSLTNLAAAGAGLALAAKALDKNNSSISGTTQPEPKPPVQSSPLSRHGGEKSRPEKKVESSVSKALKTEGSPHKSNILFGVSSSESYRAPAAEDTVKGTRTEKNVDSPFRSGASLNKSKDTRTTEMLGEMKAIFQQEENFVEAGGRPQLRSPTKDKPGKPAPEETELADSSDLFDSENDPADEKATEQAAPAPSTDTSLFSRVHKTLKRYHRY